MEKGVRTDAMIEFIDIYPTLAELFKLENTPDYLEGQSFQRIFCPTSFLNEYCINGCLI